MSIRLKSEVKQLLREPIMVLFCLLPLLTPLAFKGLMHPYLAQYYPFAVEHYTPYFHYTAFVLAPGLLGVVVGFRMLDDRDGHIFELMRVTPLGASGYLYLRLVFTAVLTGLYAFYTYVLFRPSYLLPTALIGLVILLALYGAVLGLLLFALAPDKVKGLTYAKGLNLLLLFGFVDLLDLGGLTWLARLTPTYWTWCYIDAPSITGLAIALVVHGIWLSGCLLQFKKSNHTAL